MGSERIHILFVGDDVADQESIERFVRGASSRYSLDTVTSSSDAINRLRAESYDVALIDYRYADGTAFDLLRELGDTPAIFLTENKQYETAALVLQRGAYDYLIKDPGRDYLVLLPGTIDKVLRRKHAELALRQSEARCSDLLETLMDTYLCVGEDGAILLVNKAGATQLGYSPSELIGQPLARLALPGDQEKLKDHMLVATTNPGTVVHMDLRLVTKDGRTLATSADIRAQPALGRQIPVIRVLCRAVSVRRTTWALGQGVMSALRPPAAGAVSLGMREVPAEVRGSERILVVDDVTDQRAIAAQILARMGYRVVSAESGRTAVELIRKAWESDHEHRPFDLVIMDMNLERDFDGLDTYREILKVYPDQKCIILSGGGESERVRQTQQMGAGKFVAKPYTFRELGKAVRGELNRAAHQPVGARRKPG